MAVAELFAVLLNIVVVGAISYVVYLIAQDVSVLQVNVSKNVLPARQASVSLVENAGRQLRPYADADGTGIDFRNTKAASGAGFDARIRAVGGDATTNGKGSLELTAAKTTLSGDMEVAGLLSSKSKISAASFESAGDIKGKSITVDTINLGGTSQTTASGAAVPPKALFKADGEIQGVQFKSAGGRFVVLDASSKEMAYMDMSGKIVGASVKADAYEGLPVATPAKAGIVKLNNTLRATTDAEALSADQGRQLEIRKLNKAGDTMTGALTVNARISGSHLCVGGFEDAKCLTGADIASLKGMISATATAPATTATAPTTVAPAVATTAPATAPAVPATAPATVPATAPAVKA